MELGQLSSSSETQAFQFVHSPNFPELLERLNVVLLLTTYQAGKLALFRASQGKLSLLLRTFDKAMGLAVNPQKMAVGTAYQVWHLHNAPEIASKLPPAGEHDACFMPRNSHVTGNIDVHEMCWGSREHSNSPATMLDASSELWIVNTFFSCLCTLDESSSFVPRWRPPFISEFRRQDRCHLNGLAMHNGWPKFVTAFGETDQPEGWRPGKLSGGIIMDVESGEVVARGLAMPHSPRVHNGHLWVLDSGHGRLCRVEPEGGKIETVAQLPGYTRGLFFVGHFAFVGLSQVREKAVFGGVPIAQPGIDRKCGVWVVDTRSGDTVAFLDFQASVEEIFDLQLLPGFRSPTIVGFQQETIQRACCIGQEQSIGQFRIESATTVVAQELEEVPEETKQQAFSAYSQAQTLVKQGDLPGAVAAYQAATQIWPQFPEAHNGLANALVLMDRKEDAVAAYRAATQAKPDYPKAWSNLGHILCQMDQYGAAIKACRRAIECDPAYAQAYNHLGNALRGRNEDTDADEAIAAYRQALALKSDYLKALCNLGRALLDRKRTGDLEAAADVWQSALEMDSRHSIALCGLAETLLSLGQPEEAMAKFDEALQLDPDNASAWNDRGLCWMRLGEVDKAIADYRKALELSPDNERVHVNIAFALFTLGRFEEGWSDHEWRWHDKSPTDPPLEVPWWDGTPLQGRTLVLHTEQGLGDSIQFVRFAQEVANQGEPGKVVLVCQPKLVPLLSTCPGIAQVLPKDGAVPQCDVHLPLMSVPAVLKTTLESIPNRVPYLSAKDELRERWRAELSHLRGLKLGIVWQGNTEYADDRSRSIPLKHYSALADVDGVNLISMQKGFGREQMAEVDFPLIDLGDQLDEQTGAFEETAALITELDLVVSSDTSVIHLAGALGQPVWVALCHAADWRFMLHREDSLWYPSMRLFRQQSRGDWAELFQRIASALRKVVAGEDQA